MGKIRSLLERLPRSNSFLGQAKSERSTAESATGRTQNSGTWRNPTAPSSAPNSPRTTFADQQSTTIHVARPQSPALSATPSPAAIDPIDIPAIDVIPPKDSASTDESPVTPACDTTSESGRTLETDSDISVHQLELSSPSTAQVSLAPPSTDPGANLLSPPGSSAVPTAQASAELLPLEHAFEIMQRKIWVRRPGASATLVIVSNDDLVDTVRDVILEKYRNSLGKSIDSPDITLKIVSREQTNKNVPLERILGPEEIIGRTLDSYYPGGQTIEEALIIDVPQRRTPKPSPRVGNHHPIAYPYYLDDARPGDGAREYFPPMAVHSPHLATHPPPPSGSHLPHSMAVLTTGQLPPLPSPGAHSSRKHKRPGYVRQHTSSPTVMHSSQAHSNEMKQAMPNGIAPAAPLPTPPAQADHRQSITPPNRSSSPHPGQQRRKKGKLNLQNPASTKSINGEPPAKLAQPGLLDGNVPPINVLIVEDNPINLKLLEQFMRRLKVRWKTAMNGKEAVDKWREGGFHLVLMDIQLPVMNGLEATKEIRRLEGVNGIGLGLTGDQTIRHESGDKLEISPEDKLHDMSLFKSPVIIVALTASSLQSDRHEALTVGCNDFLTKPVGYPWMLRKVTEWGCMQALIDFDGWRQWKASAEKKDAGLTEEQKKLKAKEEKDKQKAALRAMFSKPPPSSTDKAKKAEKVEDDKANIDVKPAPAEKARSPTTTTNGGQSIPLREKGPAMPSRTSRGARGSSGSGYVLETHEEESEE